MAQNKSIFSMIFLGIIIFSQTFMSIDGRYLKSNEGKQSLMKHNEASNDDIIHVSISISNAEILNMTPPNMVVNGATGESSPPPPPPGRDISDFRPTTPGHSPGIGHSIHN
ncbi:putative encoded peptide [Medicago truncatula]|uniref:Putative encoded peptide n=1 Tax=Medicago truncatula TaxID=3880 RepID=A0A396GQ14_MEDTR|nr:putative encoded peptide [Medicago truncatula]